MKYLFLLLVFPLLSANECGKKKRKNSIDNTTSMKDSIPVCIRKMIDKGNREIPPNAPLQVDEYSYNGKKVFLLTAPCCDQFNSLYDDSCQLICSPSGGITGRGDRKCEDFSTTAKHIKLLWENPSK